MSVERTTSECLELLGIEKPKFSGKTQPEVDAKLDEWKNETLKLAFHARMHEVHPDKHPDDPDASAKLLAVKEAYEQLQGLRVNLKKSEKFCPNGHERIPTMAKFCHECGHGYFEEPLLPRLRAAGITDRSISYLRSSGELDRLQEINPFSNEFGIQIKVIQQRQRLGLLSPLARW